MLCTIKPWSALRLRFLVKIEVKDKVDVAYCGEVFCTQVLVTLQEVFDIICCNAGEGFSEDSRRVRATFIRVSFHMIVSESGEWRVQGNRFSDMVGPIGGVGGCRIGTMG